MPVVVSVLPRDLPELHLRGLAALVRNVDGKRAAVVLEAEIEAPVVCVGDGYQVDVAAALITVFLQEEWNITVMSNIVHGALIPHTSSSGFNSIRGSSVLVTSRTTRLVPQYILYVVSGKGCCGDGSRVNVLSIARREKC